MPIILIDTHEKLSHQVDESIFFYKRVEGNKRAALFHEYTVNGVVNFWGLRYAIGAIALVGWENVIDADGNQVHFSPDKIPYLPGSIVTDIGILVDERSPQSFLPHSSATVNGSLPRPSEDSAVLTADAN